MTRAVVLAATLVASLTLASCGARQPGGDGARLRVIAEPETASVYLNDRFLATAKKLARSPAPVRTGIHFLTIRAQGYFPHDVELDLPEGETTVEISLRPIPP